MTRSVNAATTWDTEEVERWIENDEYLYRAIALKPGRSAKSIRVQIAAEQIPEVKLSRVDWGYLADLYKEAPE